VQSLRLPVGVRPGAGPTRAAPGRACRSCVRSRPTAGPAPAVSERRPAAGMTRCGVYS